jgi:hypothetical protein
LEDGTLLASGNVALSGREEEAVSLIASPVRPAENGPA